MCPRSAYGGVTGPFRRGTTYWAAGNPWDKHLHVVLSDPAQDPTKIYVVGVTTWDCHKDQSCILEAGEHSFVTHKSCIYYRDHRMPSLDGLKFRVQTGEYILRDPVTDQLLAKIDAGAACSKFIPGVCRDLLRAQGVIT